MAQRHDENYSEKPMTRMGRIQQPSRRYRRLRHPSFTAAIWTANNPLLQRGEFGSEIDTGKLKIGDGVTYWNDLGYVAASEIAFADITGTPDDNVALKNALDAKQDVLTEGTGIDIDSDNVISNTGVLSMATGTTNGTISVNTGGTSAEVAVYGLGSAAYTPSSDYATAAQGILADNAANKDLSNLTSTGVNIANWSSNVSNCLTEIPQDIKLELSSGNIILKTGSKLYVPDGAGTFNPITNTSDITAQSASGTNTYLIMASATLNYVSNVLLSNASSGATDSLAGTPYHVWFDTTNNVIYRYGSDGTTGVKHSFPIAIATTTNGVWTSIDQVFNGFGYIGSTVFALPGTTQLIPNRFNADGTLNNTKLTANTVQTRTLTVTISNAVLAARFNAGTPFGITSNAKYDESRNINTSSGVDWNYGFVGTISTSSGKITSFTTKQAFHAVDYSDTKFIAHQAMPSNRYVDLTLGASGATYTAPADGYLTVNKSATAAGQYINFINGSNGMNCNVIATSALPLRLCMAVSQGDVITVNYDAAGTTTMFRFIYANGSK